MSYKLKYIILIYGIKNKVKKRILLIFNIVYANIALFITSN
jgi:hypothetical protein